MEALARHVASAPQVRVTVQEFIYIAVGLVSRGLGTLGGVSDYGHLKMDSFNYCIFIQYYRQRFFESNNFRLKFG